MKRLFALLLALSAITSAFADNVSPDRALTMAREFLNNGSTKFNAGAGAQLKLAYQARSIDGKPDYYVFNLDGNGGFVVVTGDNRTVPVWGYCTSGKFDYASMPDNMKWWFSEYQRQLQYLRDNPSVKPRKAAKLATSVGPLLTSKWDQCAPYNHLCPSAHGKKPVSEGVDYYVYRAATGCVPTALAQIMNYHKWPVNGVGSKTYQSYVKEYEQQGSVVEYDRPIELSANFAQSTYRWNKMMNEYNVFKDSGNNGALTYQYLNENGVWINDNDFSSSSPNGAVAKLMSDLGIACSIVYGASERGGSSAGPEGVLDAMQNHFRYIATAHYRDNEENNYTVGGDWDQMLRDELDAGRPIFYGGEAILEELDDNGNPQHARHAFVFHGYDNEGRFYVNWGWGGNNDDAFYSTLLEKSAGYKLDHTAIFLEPNRTGKSFSANVAIPNLASLIVGSDRSTPLTVWGQNLDHDVSISVSGDASMFSTVSSISAADANSDEGRTVKVVYKPTKAGSHTAHLTLSAGEGVEPVTLMVIGSASVYCDANGNEELNIDDLAYAIDQLLSGGSLENTGTDATIDDVASIIDALLGSNEMVGLDEGLVAYYPFDGNADDASGNGNHGQVTNLTLTQGVSGDTRGAYLFGGFYNQGHIRIPNSASLKFTDGFTFACYVKPTSWGSMDGWANHVSTGGTHCIFAKSTDRNGPHLSFNGDDTGMNVGVGTMHSPSQWTSIATDGPVTGNHKNKWVHVAVTYSKNKARLYINGNLVKQRAITADFSTLNANDFYLGAFPLPGSWSEWWYPMNGVMDEVRIYNRELKSAEVNELAMDNLEDIEKSNPFKLSVSEVTLAVGQTVTVNMLNGSGNYSLGSNIGIVDFALNGDSFTLTGKGVGTTNVTVIDVATQTTILLPVTVTQPIDNHEYVDLGLPSGTLWATCNVGANSPEEYGDYFAWGETEPKDYYDRFNYKWWYYPSPDSGPFFTKYYTGNCFDGIVDNKTVLDPEDDAAYVNWGPLWRMPSREQMDELLNECSWEWTTRNGVNGELVTGPNGKTLFFPAAGHRENDEVHKVGEWGQYWSHTLGRDADAYWLHFQSDMKYCDCMVRYGGFSVRAVRVSQKNESLKLPKREELSIDKTVLLDILNGKGSIESCTEDVDRLLRE